MSEMDRILSAHRGVGAPITPLALLGDTTGFAFRTNYTPEVATYPGAPSAPASSGGSTATAVLASAQPTVVAILPDGSRVTIFAPYGEASSDYRVYAGGVLVAVGSTLLLALLAAYALGRRSGRRGR